MGSKAKKGRRFELKFCRELSLWWTDGNREDVFYHTGTSGARATVRSRVGKGTRGQYGDVAATDPIGDPFLDVATIELKKGYPKVLLGSLMDLPSTAAQQTWEEWYYQATESAALAGSFSWMIVHQRDRREPIVYTSEELWLELAVEAGGNGQSIFWPSMAVSFQMKNHRKRSQEPYAHVHACTLKVFLERVRPWDIKQIGRRV